MTDFILIMLALVLLSSVMLFVFNIFVLIIKIIARKGGEKKTVLILSASLITVFASVGSFTLLDGQPVKATPEKNTGGSIPDNDVVIRENGAGDYFFYKGRFIKIETEEQYNAAYQEFDSNGYFLYRFDRGNRQNNYDFLNKEVESGNFRYRYDSAKYSEALKLALHIKNNISFDNDALDKFYQSIYPWYDPANKKPLTKNEEEALGVINSYLNPDEEIIDISFLGEIINGVWQRETYIVPGSFLETMQFNNGRAYISMNEGADARRYRGIKGDYRLENGCIVVKPEAYTTINGGIHAYTSEFLVDGEFIGAHANEHRFPGDAILSYPVMSLSKIHDAFREYYIYKAVLFIEEPVVYYKLGSNNVRWEYYEKNY